MEPEKHLYVLKLMKYWTKEKLENPPKLLLISVGTPVNEVKSILFTILFEKVVSKLIFSKLEFICPLLWYGIRYKLLLSITVLL